MYAWILEQSPVLWSALISKIPGLDAGDWGLILILSLSWVCCWTEPKQGMEDAQWGMALITDLWGRD